MKNTLIITALFLASLSFAQSLPGGPLPGLTAQQLALFNQGKNAYEHVFSVQEGLGPVFRGQSCVACHGFPVTGGSEPNTLQNVQHFMLKNQENFMLALEMGGPVVQHQTIANVPGGSSCTLPGEVLPTVPGITTSMRHAPPVFGFGLLDAVADKTILEFQGRKPWKDPDVIGVAQWGVEMESLVRLQAFTFDISRKQPAGIQRVGRFGWKSQTATLFQFSAEPFNIELGGTSPFFPRENTPTGAPVPADCLLANAQPNDTGNQNSLNFLYFQALNAAPPKKPLTPQAAFGALLFVTSGCADCHRPQLKTTKDYYLPLADGSAIRVAALSNKVLEPYSDLLIHDMGPGLEDGRVMGRASGRFWRTTPLWGSRFKNRFMHDGRAASVDEAIDLHGGEAESSTAKYEALTPAQEAALLAFINSI